MSDREALVELTDLVQLFIDANGDPEKIREAMDAMILYARADAANDVLMHMIEDFDRVAMNHENVNMVEYMVTAIMRTNEATHELRNQRVREVYRLIHGEEMKEPEVPSNVIPLFQ